MSLSHGDGLASRLLAGAWMAVWRRAPSLLGGCRPIELLDHLPEASWRVEHHERVRAFGLCSEVVVASPRRATGPPDQPAS